MSKIDYSNYSDLELKEALNNINKEKFPDNYDALIEAAEKRQLINTEVEPEDSVNQVPQEENKFDEGNNLASLEKRFAGAFIDGLLGFIIIIFVIMPIFGFDSIFSNPTSVFDQNSFLIGIIGWIVFFILNGYLLYKKGQTVGKLIVGTRIVDDETETIPTFGKLISLRYIVFWLAGLVPFIGSVFSLVNVVFIFREDRKCIHDHLANTKVINVTS